MTELSADQCQMITATSEGKYFSCCHFVNDKSCCSFMSKPEILSLMCLIAAALPLTHPSAHHTITTVTVVVLVCSHSLHSLT